MLHQLDQPAPPDDPLQGLPKQELRELAEAARELKHCERVLTKSGETVIGELMRAGNGFKVWVHYPPGDVYDPEYHAQYYFHAHPESERYPGEHGHVHTFLRPLGMPAGIHPAPVPGLAPQDDPNDALSHLVALSLDRAGQPIRLFTTNRWCTGETWYAAADVMRMLDQFVIDLSRPSWPLNRWVTAVIRLFRPQIVELLQQRDAAVARWQAGHPGMLVYDDRGLEVPSEVPISVEAQIRAIEAALARGSWRSHQSRGSTD